VFFRNSECLACHAALGYDPESSRLITLEPVEVPGLWREAGNESSTVRYWRCRHLTTPSVCNWLIPTTDRQAGNPPQCRSCRLTRTIPDLSFPENGLLWHQIEVAKRRLVSSLLALHLPLRSKIGEDPQRGLVFDFLHSVSWDQPVITGHANGVITLDIEEAHDATREERRLKLLEPYRTLLGHLRHEIGHYYWQRLVDGTPWIEPYRELFGDERQDYAQALSRHYEQGAPVNWGMYFVSAYASSHPWEDWAETWAHYLHMVDTLDTAHSFGIEREHITLSYEPYTQSHLGTTQYGEAQQGDFLSLLNAWIELTGVLNELSRSMGVPDFYPFVLSIQVVRKLFFVHCLVEATAQKEADKETSYDSLA
jgi:hypothetical protein